jgi:hypothetical protein
LRSYLGNAIWLSDDYLDRANEELTKAPTPTDIGQAQTLIATARETLPRSQELLQLAGNLSGWFLDLSDDELAPDSDDADPQQAAAILHDFRQSADVFTPLVSDGHLTWQIPDGNLPLAHSKVVARLIEAALFQYLDTALTVGRGSAIMIGAQASGGHAVFWVRCGGETLTQVQQDALFKLNPVSAGRTSTRRTISQSIQATFQVWQIAERLSGRAYYTPGSDLTMANGFYLAVPLAVPLAMTGEAR